MAHPAKVYNPVTGQWERAVGNSGAVHAPANVSDGYGLVRQGGLWVPEKFAREQDLDLVREAVEEHHHDERYAIDVLLKHATTMTSPATEFMLPASPIPYRLWGRVMQYHSGATTAVYAMFERWNGSSWSGLGLSSDLREAMPATTSRAYFPEIVVKCTTTQLFRLMFSHLLSDSGSQPASLRVMTAPGALPDYTF